MIEEWQGIGRRLGQVRLTPFNSRSHQAHAPLPNRERSAYMNARAVAALLRGAAGRAVHGADVLVARGRAKPSPNLRRFRGGNRHRFVAASVGDGVDIGTIGYFVDAKAEYVEVSVLQRDRHNILIQDAE